MGPESLPCGSNGGTKGANSQGALREELNPLMVQRNSQLDQLLPSSFSFSQLNWTKEEKRKANHSTAFHSHYNQVV